MKRSLLGMLISVLLSTGSSAQTGTINSITFFPANLTPQDTIRIIANCTFNYSGCPAQYMAFTQTGNTFHGIAQHCLGMLTALCNKTDTFMIPPLPNGSYKFVLDLYTGSGIPCTAVFSGKDSVSFPVFGPTGITGHQSLQAFTAEYTHGTLHIHTLPVGFGIYDLRLFHINGQFVFHKAGQGEVKMPLELVPGIYFILLSNSHQRLSGKLLVP